MSCIDMKLFYNMTPIILPLFVLLTQKHVVLIIVFKTVVSNLKLSNAENLAYSRHFSNINYLRVYFRLN